MAPTLWSPELQNLSELSVKGMVEGMPRVSVPEEVCHDCVQCKQMKSKFNKFVATKTTKELELIYSDLCGPLLVETPGGSRYCDLHGRLHQEVVDVLPKAQKRGL